MVMSKRKLFFKAIEVNEDAFFELLSKQNARYLSMNQTIKLASDAILLRAQKRIGIAFNELDREETGKIKSSEIEHIYWHNRSEKKASFHKTCAREGKPFLDQRDLDDIFTRFFNNIFQERVTGERI